MICNDLLLVAIFSFHSLQLESTQKALSWTNVHQTLFCPTQLHFYNHIPTYNISLNIINNIQSLVTHLQMTVLVPNWNIAGWLPRPITMAGAAEGQKDGAGKLQAALLSKHPGMHTNAWRQTHTHTHKVHMLAHVSQSAHTAFLGFQFL